MVEVVVEYSYDAEQPDELSIKPGDVIKNVIMAEGGWWEGEMNGKKGMFPDNFVKVVKNSAEVEKREDTKKKQVQASKRQSVKDLANKIKDSVHEGPPMMRKRETAGKKKRAKVVFSYDPENDDELQLTVGDTIDILKQEEEGWWEGSLNGKQGMFPSNFVEILEEGETATTTTTATEAGEKPGPAEEGNLIKGKKVHGIGLGNIFGDGPIKLRSVTGSVKPGDKPQEPPKTEKRSEESVMRRQKDASACCTNPATPNPGPVTDPMSEYFARSDQVYEVACRDDRHNLNNSGEVVDDESVRCATFYMESSYELKEGATSDTEEMLADYNDTDLTSPDVAYVNKDTVGLKNVSNIDQGQEFGNFQVEQSEKIGRFTVNKPALDKINAELDRCEPTEYSDHLQVILDDLDSCLDQSCNPESSDAAETDSGSELDESLLACIVECKDSDSSHVLSSTNSTPFRSASFIQAIDSVYVTKKRFISASTLPACQTPTRGFDEDEQSTPRAAVTGETDIDVPTPLYLPGATKHQQATYLSSLNNSGNLSPLMRSIANKYKLFDSSKPTFKEFDVSSLVESDDDPSPYSSFMMEHTLDVQQPQPESVVEQDSVGKHTEVSDMVKSYVYNVLAGPSNEQLASSSNETWSIESDVDLYRLQQARTEDDESMRVCVDEYSVRVIDSRDNIIADIDERTGDDTDSLSSDGGVLLCMTGSDSSPPLSCCSASLYPRFDQIVKTPDTPDFDASESMIQSGIGDRSSQSKHNVLPNFSALSVHTEPKLPDSGPIRATSSYCRIPFKDEGPSFWFKKDFNQSPCRSQGYRGMSKVRSPKRTIREISDSFPSLFTLAERIYLEEFKLKIEAFKAENLKNVQEKSPYFYNGRSPARKKRKKVYEGKQNQVLTPAKAINFNANASGIPTEPCLQIDPEMPGSVDAYFAEKSDSPCKIVQQVVPSASPAQMDLHQQSDSGYSAPEYPRIDWSESLFNKRSCRKKSRGSKKVRVQDVQLSATIGDTRCSHQTKASDNGSVKSDTKAAERHHMTDSTDDDLDDLINSCTEKRRKRRFLPRSKSDRHENPVKLIGYNKLDTGERVKKRAGLPTKAKSTSYVRTDRTVSVVDLILRQDSSVFGSTAYLQKKCNTLPRHKIEAVMCQMAEEHTNDVLSYFDHGDEPCAGNMIQTPQNSLAVEANTSIDKTMTSLQEAVEEHETAVVKSTSISQAIRMLNTREKMYEAISEAVSFCADEIVKEIEVQDLSENRLDESLAKPEKSYDLTPDTETLERDLNAIDLCGTPVYANTEGDDNDMKVFLDEAMESFDNILNDSFGSSSELSDDESSVGPKLENEQLDNEEPQSVDDKENVSFIELDDDSILVVIGNPCTLHESVERMDESYNEDNLCPDQCETTFEVGDDSVLNVVGQKCHIHVEDKADVVHPLKDLCYKIVQQLANECSTTLRFREVTNANYDEAHEVEDKTDHGLKTPEMLKSSNNSLKRPGALYSNIPGFFCAQSTLEQGIEIGIPDYESSPLLKMASDKVDYYNTEELLLDEEEFMYIEGPTETEILKASAFGHNIHNTSPVEYADMNSNAENTDLLKEKIDGMLETIKERADEETEADVSDDSRWMEEHMSATRARTPANDAEDLVMSECPSQFEEKVSSYPSSLQIPNP